MGNFEAPQAFEPITPGADALAEENKKLAKKSFELARALASAQRRISEQNAQLEELRSRHNQWVEAVQLDLNFLYAQLVEASEAWAWYQASAPERHRYEEVRGDLEERLFNSNSLEEAPE
ncbi:hypothetical protein DYH09_13400 [bacterium CPR1]|nr:hypothetical protein [bacterium CPR1]